MSFILLLNQDVKSILRSEVLAGTFISLTDTPNSYSGQTGKIPIVNSSGDGLEFKYPNEIIYDLDSIPSSPSVWNDEFSGSTLNTTLWENPAVTACAVDVSVSGGKVSIEPSASGSGSTSLRGLFGIKQKTCPTGSFSVETRVFVNGGADDARAGVFVANTANTKAYLLGCHGNAARYANAIGTNNYSASSEWGVYNGFDSYTSSLFQLSLNGLWYKLVWDSSASTYTYMYSTNGTSWISLGTSTSMLQPDVVGIGMYANTQNILANHLIYFSHFRITEF